MTREEKIYGVLNYREIHQERHYKAVYLNALRTNNQAVIEEYERFGDDPRKIIQNIRAYEKGLPFGFTDIDINEYGWLKQHPFVCERIEFKDKKGRSMNYIDLGKSPNGKWVYGLMWWTPDQSGGANGPSVWGEMFNDRISALKAAIRQFVYVHERAESPDTHIIKQAMRIFEDITSAKQQSLF